MSDGDAPIRLDTSKIRAVVRVRPAKPDEETYLQTEPRSGKKLVAGQIPYSDTFSLVLGPESTQHEVFRAVGLPFVEATLRAPHAGTRDTFGAECRRRHTRPSPRADLRRPARAPPCVVA
eukprot:2065652-Prymnesium_polylepis.1